MGYNTLCGTWVNDFDNRAYQFFDDGMYKKCDLDFFGEADERDNGSYTIYDKKTIYGYSGFDPFVAPEVCNYNEETGFCTSMVMTCTA